MTEGKQGGGQFAFHCATGRIHILHNLFRVQAHGACTQQIAHLFKGIGKSRQSPFQAVLLQGIGQILQDSVQRGGHALQRQALDGALERIHRRWNGGDFILRRGRAEIGRAAGVKIQLNAILPGNEALQLQPRPHAPLHHAADDFLMKAFPRRTGVFGQHKTAFVDTDVDRDGDVGITRIGH